MGNGIGLFHLLDADKGSSLGFFEFDQAGFGGEYGVITAETDILARFVFGTSLADDNLACFYFLAAE